MSTTTKVLLSILALVVSYAFGYWTAPETIKTETKIVEVEKTSKDTTTDTSKTRNKKIVIVEITRPDGTKEKSTTITDDTQIDRKKETSEDTTVNKDTTEMKEVTTSSSKTHLSALSGIDIFSPQSGLVYGGAISKEVLGPISIGVWGLSNGLAGCSVGLTF